VPKRLQKITQCQEHVTTKELINAETNTRTSLTTNYKSFNILKLETIIQK
jgi:hypothetical protein